MLADNSWNDPVTFKSAIKGVNNNIVPRWTAKLIHDSTVVKSSSRRNEGQFRSSLNYCTTINISSNRLFQQWSFVRFSPLSSLRPFPATVFNGFRTAHARSRWIARVLIYSPGREKRKRHAYLLIIDSSSYFMLSHIL